MPIDIRLFGILTVFNEDLPLKTLSPIRVTVLPSIVSGTVTELRCRLL